MLRFFRPDWVIYTLVAIFISGAWQLAHAVNNSWFVGIGGGIYKNQYSSSTTSVANGVTSSPPYNLDIYSINSSSANNLDLLGGYRWQINNKYFRYQSLFGLYRHYFNSTIKGTDVLFNLPAFTNYNYKMIYNADLFSLNYKLNIFEFKKLLPYLAIGAGYIINNVNNYTETATPNVTPRISPNYTGNTTYNLAGSLGIGIDYILTPSYRLTIGYERLFQGNINSGSGASSWSGTSLHFGTLKTDTVFVHITADIPEGFRR